MNVYFYGFHSGSVNIQGKERYRETTRPKFQAREFHHRVRAGKGQSPIEHRRVKGTAKMPEYEEWRKDTEVSNHGRPYT